MTDTEIGPYADDLAEFFAAVRTGSAMPGMPYVTSRGTQVDAWVPEGSGMRALRVEPHPTSTREGKMEEQKIRWGTLAEAAEHLQLSPWTVRRMVARGQVDARKFSGQIRVNMSTLDEAGEDLAWKPGRKESIPDTSGFRDELREQIASNEAIPGGD